MATLRVVTIPVALLALLVNITIAQSASRGSFLLMAPDYLIPGFNYTIGFESFLDQPWTLNASVFTARQEYHHTYHPYYRTFVEWREKRIYAITQETFVKGKLGKLNLAIPEHMPLTKDEDVFWAVECVNMDCSSEPWREDVTQRYMLYGHPWLVEATVSLFVQTDKAIYKPGQTVRYRVFAVYPDLKMYNGSFSVEVMDPNGNKIQLLSNVPSVEGVVEGSLRLADHSIFGDWTVLAQIQTSTNSFKQSKSFTVTEYQLPKFEIKVNVPSYLVRHDDSELSGTVTATYTFGRPVKGLVELQITRLYTYYSYYDRCDEEMPHVELTFNIDGEANFSVPVAEILRHFGSDRLRVKATVKEELTGVRLEGSATSFIASKPYKVSIMSNTLSVFKPGFPYSVFAQVARPDNTPVGGGNNTITMVTTAYYTIHAENSFLFGGTTEFTGTYPLPLQTVAVPPDGVVMIHLDVPANASGLDITVDFKGITDDKSVSKMYSASNNFLLLTLLGQDLKSRQTARLKAEATEPIGTLRYQVLSRGVVQEMKVVDTQGQNETTFDIALTPEMAPTTHVLAYYVRHDGETIPDGIAFNVEGVFNNEVTIELSSNKSEPHTELDVYLTADPNSVVHLLSVDQSVLLLQSGNDVTPDQVAAEIARFVAGTKGFEGMGTAWSLSATSAESTLENAGVSVYSDMDLSRTEAIYPSLPNDPSIYGPVVLHTALTTTAYPLTSPVYPAAYIGSTPVFVPPEEPARVRTIFPETWLWLSTAVGANGTAVVHTTVPDTITSWITTAFATNMQTGLGMAPSPVKLTVFSSFFVSLTFPSSVVRGEHVVIQASVFNYLPENLTVLVTMPGSTAYQSLVIGTDGSEVLETGDQERIVFVKSNEQVAVYFPIIPVALGAIDIEVSARSNLSADAVRRQLMVEAEGVPSEYGIPVFVNLDSSGTQTFSQTFPVELPPDVVDGSTWSRIKVTGDLLGPSIDGLDNLLRMPTGCGEQNMVRLAPDLYVANYLKVTGQMTPPMEERINRYIEAGYQRQLTHQRQDGAFSSFGNKDAVGSTWLTAFVLRVFHEARPYVYVDSGVLQRSLDWLVERQNEDGSFNEFGAIYDPEIRQFQDHSAGLTSFVLFALLENDDVPSSAIKIEERQRKIEELGNATSRALAFLESTYHELTDDLSLALTCLALTKIGSSAADQAFAILSDHAITEHGMTYWKSNTSVSNKFDTYTRWRPSHVRARPIDIQITSYALLVHAARGMFQEGMSILHWLTLQRNPYGGFSSTQDTVVGLQAMTEFLQQAASSGFDLRLNVKAGVENPTFDISTSNSLVLQLKDLSYIPSEVTFNASGKGVALAELDVFFNVEKDMTEPAFEVSTVLLDDYLNSFKLMICTRWLLAGNSGMVVQEVGIPSGFAPDMSSVGNVAGIKRVEQKGRFLDAYFEKVTKNAMCFSVLFDRQSMVARSQESYIVTQDYYEPTNRATASYVPTSLRDATVCDVCPGCCPKA